MHSVPYICILRFNLERDVQRDLCSDGLCGHHGRDHAPHHIVGGCHSRGDRCISTILNAFLSLYNNGVLMLTVGDMQYVLPLMLVVTTSVFVGKVFTSVCI